MTLRDGGSILVLCWEVVEVVGGGRSVGCDWGDGLARASGRCVDARLAVVGARCQRLLCPSEHGNILAARDCSAKRDTSDAGGGGGYGGRGDVVGLCGDGTTLTFGKGPLLLGPLLTQLSFAFIRSAFSNALGARAEAIALDLALSTLNAGSIQRSRLFRSDSSGGSSGGNHDGEPDKTGWLIRVKFGSAGRWKDGAHEGVVHVW